MSRPSDPLVTPPVIEVAVEATGAAALAKLDAVLADLSRADAMLAIRVDPERAQRLLCGQSEEHLDTLIDRLRCEFGIPLSVGAPQVAYRETIGRTCEVDFAYEESRQGKRAFARLKLRLAPGGAGSGASVRIAIEKARLPHPLLIGAERGARRLLAAGVLAGFPVTDIIVTIFEGAYHHQDSSDLAFEIAASAAMREGLAKAGSLLLEPVMDLQISIPTICLDAVLRDLRQRSGAIDSREPDGDVSSICAHAPLTSLFGYRNSLKAITRKRNTIVMRFREYASVPRIERPDDPRFPPAAALRA